MTTSDETSNQSTTKSYFLKRGPIVLKEKGGTKGNSKGLPLKVDNTEIKEEIYQLATTAMLL